MRLSLFYLLVGFFVLGSSLRAESNEEIHVRDKTFEWLQILDENRYDEAWNLCNSDLQAEVEQAEWVGGLEQVRKPLGMPIKRVTTKLVPTDSLPDAPEGRYLVLVFKTEFMNIEFPMTEVVILEKNRDLSVDDPSAWTVSSYYLSDQVG